MTDNIYQIANEIAAERVRQQEEGFNAAVDDLNEPQDWHDIIESYNAWARLKMDMGSMDKARRRYIQIAALAVAAVESIDRRMA